MALLLAGGFDKLRAGGFDKLSPNGGHGCGKDQKPFLAVLSLQCRPCSRRQALFTLQVAAPAVNQEMS